MRAQNGWFDVYAAAIMESDLDKIHERVARARKAIADRVAQLEAGDLAGNREPRDLQDALDKLQILVNVSYTMSPHSYALLAGPSDSRRQLERAV